MVNRGSGGRGPKVSVILPAFNAESTVGRALASVVAQAVPDVELIVVNDGSTDGTADVVRALCPTARIVTQPNRGVAAARNTGIANARGELIAFLDADDEWHAGKLKRQLGLLSERPGAGWTYSSAIYRRASDGRIFPRRRRLYHRADGLVTGNPIVTSSVVVRSMCLHAAGGYFLENVEIGEDWELWIRLSHRYPAAPCGEPLVTYTWTPFTKYQLHQLETAHALILEHLASDAIVGHRGFPDRRKLEAVMESSVVDWLLAADRRPEARIRALWLLRNYARYTLSLRGVALALRTFVPR
jgi:glycosyltransferase involved in cell wall biosynthesis